MKRKRTFSELERAYEFYAERERNEREEEREWKSAAEEEGSQDTQELPTKANSALGVRTGKRWPGRLPT
jgi:hypothetical protein